MGEDQFKMTEKHLTLYSDYIRNRYVSVRRQYIESNRFRRPLLERLNLVGRAKQFRDKNSKIVTVFSEVKRVDKALWIASSDSVRKNNTSLAWLNAPKEAWLSTTAVKCKMQQSVTTYKIAQLFVKANK